jgi:microcystin-dependent protein
MEPYIGEIRCFSFGRIPSGWTACNGQLLPINQNQALYSLIGTYYGGDGRTNFQLPNLNGRAPVHYNTSQQGLPNYPTKVGDKLGSETVTLTSDNLPAHQHMLQASTAAATLVPATNNFLANVPSPHFGYVAAPADQSQLAALDPSVVSSDGSGAAHTNMQPYLALNFCIATIGYYPPRPD